MSRKVESLSKTDMQALGLARTWGIQIDQGSAAQEALDDQLPRYSAGPLREVTKRQIRDSDGKTWRARDAGQLFAQHSFIDRKPK